MPEKDFVENENENDSELDSFWGDSIEESPFISVSDLLDLLEKKEQLTQEELGSFAELFKGLLENESRRLKSESRNVESPKNTEHLNDEEEKQTLFLLQKANSLLNKKGMITEEQYQKFSAILYGNPFQEVSSYNGLSSEGLTSQDDLRGTTSPKNKVS